ncbi:MAG: SAM-dependent methyltransferase [Bacillota bacterium]
MSKLKLVCLGLAERLGRLEDFVSLKLTAPDGEARLEREDAGYAWVDAAGSRAVAVAEVPGMIEAALAKGGQVELVERGAAVTIEASPCGDVKVRYADTAATPRAPGERQVYLPLDSAGPLLKAIGLTTAAGALRTGSRRKYNQVEHFIELLDGLLRRLGGDNLHILDAGCGAAYLTFALNYYIRDRLKRPCTFTGIDLDVGVIARAQAIQAELGYRNMEFRQGAIANLDPAVPVTLVVSLHACDTATDEALALGVARRARAIVAVPCCQHELRRQVAPGDLADLLRHPLLAARFADLLTDALRALYLESQGYRVSLVEYVSPLDTPKNLMLRAELAGGPSGRRAEAFTALCRRFGVQPALPGLAEAAKARWGN